MYQRRKGESSGSTISEGSGSMARWALDGRPLPWPLGKRRAGGLRGGRPGEIVIARFADQLPGFGTGWRG